MKSICLITCYMGPLPGYFDYYVASCKKNKTISYIVINDTIDKSFVDENIQYIKLSLAELNKTASGALNENIQIKSAWKINELKPLFGNIFKEQLKAYDYWGWCDLDIIWGDLRKFLTDDMLSAYDVITSKANWTAGHFTLFKNTALLNNIYKENPDVIALLNDATYYAFEECCHRWDGIFSSPEALQKQNLPLSMFDIIKNAESQGKIKAHFKDIIREYPQPINYVYENGRLLDKNNGEEFMYYHLITVKKIWRFFIPAYKAGYNDLIITASGIRPKNNIKLLWLTRRAYACLVGIKKSAAKQKPGDLVKKLFR